MPTALAVDVPHATIQPVMAGLDPVIFIEWLLTGIASFAIDCGETMAGSSPTRAGVESWYLRRLV